MKNMGDSVGVDPLEALLKRVAIASKSFECAQSLTDAIVFVFDTDCSLCYGKGHSYIRCSVRRVIRRTLKRAGKHTQWKRLKDDMDGAALDVIV